MDTADVIVLECRACRFWHDETPAKPVDFVRRNAGPASIFLIWFLGFISDFWLGSSEKRNWYPLYFALIRQESLDARVTVIDVAFFCWMSGSVVNTIGKSLIRHLCIE